MSQAPIQAAFVAVRLPDGKIAATTRASNSAGVAKIGLPGGKLDPGEALRDAALREAAEEGWAIAELDEAPYYTAMVDNFECHWFAGRGAAKLDTFKEKGRIKPIEVDICDLKTPGLGNDKAMEAFETKEGEDLIQNFVNYCDAHSKPGHGLKTDDLANFETLQADLARLYGCVRIDLNTRRPVNSWIKIDTLEYAGAWQEEISEAGKGDLSRRALAIWPFLQTIAYEATKSDFGNLIEDIEHPKYHELAIELGPKNVLVEYAAIGGFEDRELPLNNSYIPCDRFKAVAETYLAQQPKGEEPQI